MRAAQPVRAPSRHDFILRGLLIRGLHYTGPMLLIYYIIGAFIHANPELFPEAREVCLAFGLLTLLIGWRLGVAEWSRCEPDKSIMPGNAPEHLPK